MILETAVNLSFINNNNNIPKRLTYGRYIQKPNGMFRRNTEETINMTKGNRATTDDALVHKKLPLNLLSTNPIVQDIGPIIIDNTGAKIVSDNVYIQVKPQLQYFANRKNKLYEVDVKDGEV